MAPVLKQIKETKDHSVYVACKLVGKGTIDEGFRAEVSNDGLRIYGHMDADSDIDYKHKKARIYVNKLRTPTVDVEKVRKKYTIIDETG